MVPYTVSYYAAVKKWKKEKEKDNLYEFIMEWFLRDIKCQEHTAKKINKVFPFMWKEKKCIYLLRFSKRNAESISRQNIVTSRDGGSMIRL